MIHLVLLDNEAVQALGHPDHAKHRRVVSYVQVVAHRKQRAKPIYAAVPTCVRVEAGWDRTAPASAFLNRLRVVDVPLDTAGANVAARIRHEPGVSVPDAHLGAVIQTSTSQKLTVITSDPKDMRAIAGTGDVTIVAL